MCSGRERRSLVWGKLRHREGERCPQGHTATRLGSKLGSPDTHSFSSYSPEWQHAEWLSGWANGRKDCEPAEGTREQVRVSEQKSGQSVCALPNSQVLLLAVRMSVWRDGGREELTLNPRPGPLIIISIPGLYLLSCLLIY